MTYLDIDPSLYLFDIPQPSDVEAHALLMCPCPSELAKELGIPFRTVKRWLAEGRLPATTKTAAHHNEFWTEDALKEVFINASLLLLKGEAINE